jgi:hypothetical protein
LIKMGSLFVILDRVRDILSSCIFLRNFANSERLGTEGWSNQALASSHSRDDWAAHWTIAGKCFLSDV